MSADDLEEAAWSGGQNAERGGPSSHSLFWPDHATLPCSPVRWKKITFFVSGNNNSEGV